MEMIKDYLNARSRWIWLLKYQALRRAYHKAAKVEHAKNRIGDNNLNYIYLIFRKLPGVEIGRIHYVDRGASTPHSFSIRIKCYYLKYIPGSRSEGGGDIDSPWRVYKAIYRIYSQIRRDEKDGQK